MILSSIAAKLKQRAKADFKGRHYEASFIGARSADSIAVAAAFATLGPQEHARRIHIADPAVRPSLLDRALIIACPRRADTRSNRSQASGMPLSA